MTLSLTQCSTRAATAAASGAAPWPVRRSDLRQRNCHPAPSPRTPLISTLPPNGRTRSRTPMRPNDLGCEPPRRHAAAVILDGEHQLVGVGPHATSCGWRRRGAQRWSAIPEISGTQPWSDPVSSKSSAGRDTLQRMPLRR